MDFSKFKTSDWLLVGGGAAMLILGLFLDWTSIGGASGDTPFNYFFTGGIAWILVSAVGVLALLRASGKLPESQPWDLIFVAATGLATVLMLLRVILGGRDLGFGIDGDRGIGMMLAFVWAAIALGGAVMKFTESGGDLKDLTDMDKLKGAFDSGDAPGGDTPPPPPPPPAQ